jgi:predicted amidophosphoribosyltransferase
MQSLLRLIYPAQCISCDALLADDMALCGTCWRNTPFIAGTVCDACGVPLPGEGDGRVDLCDDCLTIARPWASGRAAPLYKGNARRMVLSLKHGDRLELAKPAARWMQSAAAPLLARLTGATYVPDALIRSRRTAVQDGMSLNQRFQNMSQAIAPHPKYSHALTGKNVLLIDDVMTSGATLAAATEACAASGATRICVLVLARVAKDT